MLQKFCDPSVRRCYCGGFFESLCFRGPFGKLLIDHTSSHSKLLVLVMKRKAFYNRKDGYNLLRPLFHVRLSHSRELLLKALHLGWTLLWVRSLVVLWTLLSDVMEWGTKLL